MLKVKYINIKKSIHLHGKKLYELIRVIWHNTLLLCKYGIIKGIPILPLYLYDQGLK